MSAFPQITIGITTYNRIGYLRECVNSLLASSYQDFEIIIGNDYVQQTLQCSDIGVTDPRVRILNHPVNLGELGNLKALLNAARGEYFTWQADDDYYSPRFLDVVGRACYDNPHI